MGLCKCPKRKVTNLFCFEHRVNVCEHCLIENHPRCVVQSYLNWLKDSDYNPNCGLCGVSLTEGEVVRLMSYDVYHVACLEKYYSDLPPNTAPAGYIAPNNGGPLFPKENQAGPVVDKLRQVLSKCKWARVGLGLPLIDDLPLPIKEENEVKPLEIVNENSSSLKAYVKPQVIKKPKTSVVKPMIKKEEKVPVVANSYNNSAKDWSSPPILQYDRSPLHTTARKFPQSSNSHYSAYHIGNVDHDADKYKKKSPFSFITRWIKSRQLRCRKMSRQSMIAVVVTCLLFIMLVTITLGSGRNPNYDDEKINNPNIHVKNVENFHAV